MSNLPPRRKHLRRLRFVWVDPAIFYITTNTMDRRAVLAPSLADIVVEALAEAGRRNGWSVGRYVVMPDHVHFFCQGREVRKSLDDFVGGFKQMVTRLAWDRDWSGALWQAEFFDHVLRSEESYAQKWEYVRQNPVRKGLCQTAEEWPHQGEIEHLPGR